MLILENGMLRWAPLQPLWAMTNKWKRNIKKSKEIEHAISLSNKTNQFKKTLVILYMLYIFIIYNIILISGDNLICNKLIFI